MKKIFLIFVFLISLFLSHSLYAIETGSIIDNKNKSIRELDESIKETEKAKENLIITKDFILDKTLETFLKKDLTRDDLNRIWEFAKVYIDKKNILEIKITQAAKNLVDTEELTKNLSDLTLKFYEDLLDFIDKNKYSNYIQYIKEETNFYIGEKELNIDIIKKTEIKNEKIIIIENKIIEHKNNVEETLKDLVYSRVDEKTTQFTQDNNFINFSINEKTEFINSILAKLEETKNNLVLQNESSKIQENTKANNEKKISICKFMEERFTEFRDDLKD